MPDEIVQIMTTILDKIGIVNHDLRIRFSLPLLPNNLPALYSLRNRFPINLNRLLISFTAIPTLNSFSHSLCYTPKSLKVENVPDHSSVEFTSPTIITVSGFSAMQTSSMATMIFAV